MEKIIVYAPRLIKRALAGDPVAIGLLAFAGISIVHKGLTEKKDFSKEIAGRTSL